MIDYQWLRVFTQIIQSFGAVLLLIFLWIKYDQLNLLIKLFSAFLCLKILTDLFGIVKYTNWMYEAVGDVFLFQVEPYMGLAELSMAACFYLLAKHLQTQHQSLKIGDSLVFIPAFALFFMAQLITNYPVLTLWLFVIQILVFIVIINRAAHLQRIGNNPKAGRLIVTFAYVLNVWNVMWLIQVLGRRIFLIMNKDFSLKLIIITEIVMTVGFTYLLIEIVSRPKLLQFTKQLDVLPPSMIRVMEINIAEVMKNKIYHRPDVNISSFAAETGLPTQYVSTYLNRILKVNFNQFITNHRIEDSKQQLEDRCNNQTIEQIMHSVGFNSKSVFNTAFKEQTGVTPSEFRKHCRL